ncbi:hypothetical protein HYALB_00011614 [Hymenoscyphus albidus]|uniref:Enoyl reductase (ER) domain-containing protein n=1 Tax=Hymenoscyphus albidus TaxID=595503 RepID=A0A9N9LKA8_9HELO|nr:hypothetical protein HYALB_00011614 [Hymenoscyphus albidus]
MVEFTVYKGSADRKIVQSKTTREIKPDQVLVEVTHSGVCGTDEHHKGKDMVLGHEGAGVVKEIGSAVKTLKEGDSVGWGYQHDACGHCKQCYTAHETLCPNRSMYGNSDLDQGSFATHAVWKEDYLFKIPDSISREFAAPLQCGGATVFNVLHSFAVKPTHHIGVIGIGGLGHLAIQFAAKMGCNVTVFSSTDSKKEEAMRLGATEFVATKNVKELQVSGQIDHLLVCTSFQPDWKQFLPIMAPSSSIYPLTVSPEDFQIPYMPLLMKELKIQGSLVATRAVQNEMLAFAALHQIRPVIEKFPLTTEGIEEAMAKLEKGGMRYRAVLVAQ